MMCGARTAALTDESENVLRSGMPGGQSYAEYLEINKELLRAPNRGTAVRSNEIAAEKGAKRRL